MSFLDASGFKKKSLAEIRRELEAEYQTTFGVDADLSPDGPLGQLISIQAKREADMWDGLQEFYASRDKDQATGVSLDEVLNPLGVYRLAATAARIDDVVLWLTFGASVTVPLGSTAKSSTAPDTYALESDVVQAASVTGPFRAVRLSLATLTVGNTLSVTLDGTAYTHLVTTGESVADALGLLATSIEAGAFGLSGSAEYESISGVDYLRIDGTDFTLNAFSADFAGGQSAQAGIFVASSTGALATPALTLDTISSPVSGWLAVEQPAAGTNGTDLESDTAFRIRALRGLRSGTGTDQAIQEALYRVDGVSKAFVYSNRSGSTDAEGRPANAFEAVVIGGSDLNVATAIYNTMPAGIEPYGTTSQAVTGSDGIAHDIAFSRPVPQYAHVEVTLVATDPDGGPTGDYEQAIKDAVSQFGRANFDLGDNFTVQKFFSPVYSVPGIYSATLRIAVTTTAAGTPTWSSSNILVASREYLSFDSSRVTVL